VATTITSLRQLDAGRRARQGARGRIAPVLTGESVAELGHDSSTNALIRRYRAPSNHIVPKEA